MKKDDKGELFQKDLSEFTLNYECLGCCLFKVRAVGPEGILLVMAVVGWAGLGTRVPVGRGAALSPMTLTPNSQSIDEHILHVML